MTAVLLDTHVWAWSLSNDVQLSESARTHIAGASLVYISPISLFEIGQKVRIGKWPEMVPYVRDLPRLVAEQGALVASLSPDICLSASILPWAHRDPFDRLLAATALALNAKLVSMDVAFDSLQDWPGRIPD